MSVVPAVAPLLRSVYTRLVKLYNMRFNKVVSLVFSRCLNNTEENLDRRYATIEQMRLTTSPCSIPVWSEELGASRGRL